MPRRVISLQLVHASLNRGGNAQAGVEVFAQALPHGGIKSTGDGGGVELVQGGGERAEGGIQIGKKLVKPLSEGHSPGGNGSGEIPQVDGALDLAKGQVVKLPGAVGNLEHIAAREAPFPIRGLAEHLVQPLERPHRLIQAARQLLEPRVSHRQPQPLPPLTPRLVLPLPLR